MRKKDRFDLFRDILSKASTNNPSVNTKYKYMRFNDLVNQPTPPNLSGIDRERLIDNLENILSNTKFDPPKK
jgi:hypothetical protein